MSKIKFWIILLLVSSSQLAFATELKVISRNDILAIVHGLAENKLSKQKLTSVLGKPAHITPKITDGCGGYKDNSYYDYSAGGFFVGDDGTVTVDKLNIRDKANRMIIYGTAVNSDTTEQDFEKIIKVVKEVTHDKKSHSYRLGYDEGINFTFKFVNNHLIEYSFSDNDC